MFSKLKIGPRLLSLISVQVLVSLIIAGMAAMVLVYATDTSTDLNRRVASQAKLTGLSERLRTELVGTVHDLNLGVMSWPEAEATCSARAPWTEVLSGSPTASCKARTPTSAPRSACCAATSSSRTLFSTGRSTPGTAP